MRNPLGPAIYSGKVRHRRFQPAEHSFEYSIFMVLLDIDRIAEQMEVSRLTGYNRWAPAAFYDADHFGDAHVPLRERLRMDAASHGHQLPAGPIYLLTHLRYFGYCFNPISLYYCYEPQASQPSLILAEVHSTFGEQYNYWLPGLKTDGVDKKLHVSPFNTMDNRYNFRLSAPGDALAVHIDTLRQGECFFDATLALRAEPWSAANLKRALISYPWMTVQVIAAIHLEALRLFFKRVPFVPHPSKTL